MKSSTWIGIIVVILVAAIVCVACGLAGVLLIRPDLFPLSWPGGLGGQVILSQPTRSGESDLLVLRAGQSAERGVVLAQGVRPGAGEVLTWLDGRAAEIGSQDFGGFLNDDEILVQAMLDGENRLLRLPVSGREIQTIFESDSGRFTAFVGQGGEDILIADATGTGLVRCYLARPGEDPQRVARGDACLISADGRSLLVAETVSDGTDLTVMDLDGTGESLVLESEPAVRSYRLSADGGQVAYVRAQPDEGERLVVLARDGGLLYESDLFYALADYGFAAIGDGLYFIGETDAGDMELHTTSGRIATAYSLSAAFSSDGSSLVYLAADTDGRGTVSSYAPSDGSSSEILDGQGLSFAILPSPSGFLVRQAIGDELALFASLAGAGETVRLFDQVGYFLQTAQVIGNPPTVFLTVQESGSSLSLYAASLETGEGDFVLESWAEVQPLDLSADGGRLLLAGREDPSDPAGLYLAELGQGAELRLLDDDFDAVLNGVFDAGERRVWYTVSLGPDADQVEVRRVEADGERPPEALYPESTLVDVEWRDLYPFRASFVDFQTALTASGYCPGATVLTPATPLEDDLTAGGENCYSFRAAEGQAFTIRVLADHPDLDSRLYLYTRSGRQIGGDDDSGPGLNPRLLLTAESAGLYFVTVVGFGSEDAGTYTIEMQPGMGDLGFPTARQLGYDAAVQGSIGAQDEIYLEHYGWTVFGAMYAFETGVGDWLQIDVDSEASQAARPLSLVLFDPQQAQVAYGSADLPGTDLQFLTALGGQHYLLIGLLDESIPDQEVFFDVRLSLGEPPEPGGGPIEYGETLEGFITSQPGDVWTFDGEQGDEVTITMRSTAIDSTLTLRGPDGTELRYDDDGAGYPDSMIFGIRLPETGSYSIESRSLGGNPGAYTLSLQLGPLGGGGEIGREQTVEGILQAGVQDRWTFQGRVGEQVTIVLTSEAFDTYLELYDPDGGLLMANDDAGTTRRSEIRDYSLPIAGEYAIVVRGFRGSGAGPYTLELR